MESIKTGLIGCGKVAHYHAAALKALPESKFTAVCGTSMPQAENFAAKYGVAAYADVPKFLAESGVWRMVCVCTPHPLHASPTVLAAEAGVHSLVEKPLASTLEDCDRMIAAAHKNSVKLGTICQRRFYEPCQRIRRAIDDRKIGTPVLGSVAMYGYRDQKYYASDPWRGSRRGEGGGVLVNQAPHQLDMLLWYMGEVAELTGYWANLNHPYIEVEDTAVAIVRFKNGRWEISSSAIRRTRPFTEKSWYTARMANRWRSDRWRRDVHRGNDRDQRAAVQRHLDGARRRTFAQHICAEQDADFFAGIDPIVHYHTAQIRDFLAAIAENRPPLITGQDGRRTVELFTAIYRSQRDQSPVRFPLTTENSVDTQKADAEYDDGRR